MSVSCQNLFFSYKDAKRSDILENLSFDLENNETLCLYGGTASGKTTLFSLLFGELSPTKGKILIDSCLILKEKYLKNKVTFLFQEPEKQFVFPSIQDEYDFICTNSDDNSISQNINKICDLFKVKVQNYFDRNIYQLSYGELRLLQIIFSLSANTQYLILDEPGEYLETKLQHVLFSLLTSMKNRGILILTKYPELYKVLAGRNIPIHE